MSAQHDDIPPGLPGPLPAGEKMLWQGSPNWRTLARQVFHVRIVAAYFGFLMVWRVASGASEGLAPATIAVSALPLAAVAAAGIGLLLLLSVLFSRATIYTITSRRIVMRYGVALPRTVNLPFATIGSAALKVYANGDGDIPLALTGSDQIGYIHLWPHVRPWRFKRAEPMLRAIPEAARVGAILSEALAAALASRQEAAPSKSPETAAPPRLRSFDAAA